MLVDSNDWRVFTGNEMGCLLIWWMIHVYKSKGVGPGKMYHGLAAAAWFKLTVGWVYWFISHYGPLLCCCTEMELTAVLMVLLTSVVHTYYSFFALC